MRNKNGVSHTGRVRGQFHADEASVLFFTGMDLNELTDLKMDMGKEWIMKHCKENGISDVEAEEMWKEEQLLQWWNLQWKRMDHYVILPILHRFESKDAAEVYKEMHYALFLADHPNYQMLVVSLMAVMHRLGENLTNKLKEAA